MEVYQEIIRQLLVFIHYFESDLVELIIRKYEVE